MLLDFKFNNFKTFQEETLFSKTPAQKIKDIEYSVLKTKIGKKEYKGLSSAVIYGPNASGKTNIISALEVFKTPIQMATTAVSGVAGLAEVTVDEVAYVVSPDGTRISQISPNEVVQIAFGTCPRTASK